MTVLPADTFDAIEARANAAAQTWTHYEWLIERGQPEGLDNAVWFSHYHESVQWTTDANKAAMFPTRESAEAWITTEGLSARAVEHGFMRRVNDADFIAHARTDIPALLAEVRRLQARTDELAEALAVEQARD